MSTQGRSLEMPCRSNQTKLNTSYRRNNFMNHRIGRSEPPCQNVSGVEHTGISHQKKRRDEREPRYRAACNFGNSCSHSATRAKKNGEYDVAVKPQG